MKDRDRAAGKSGGAGGRLAGLILVLAAALGVAVWHFWPREQRHYVQPLSLGSFDHAHRAWGEILRRHGKEGRLDHASLAAEPGPLRACVRGYSAVLLPDFAKWPQPQQIAFLLNAHNAAAAAAVVERWPVGGIEDMGGLLRGARELPVVPLFGRRWTSREIREQWMEKYFPKAGAGEALTFALPGEPPLPAEPYLPSRLQAQLAERGRAQR